MQLTFAEQRLVIAQMTDTAMTSERCWQLVAPCLSPGRPVR
jgi:hypothetical protein